MPSIYLRGCLRDTEATFIPAQVHPGSLLWLCICLHDNTRELHTGMSRTGVSSLWLLYQSENFILVRNLTTVSCKQRAITCFSVTSVSWETGTKWCMFSFYHPIQDGIA